MSAANVGQAQPAAEGQPPAQPSPGEQPPAPRDATTPSSAAPPSIIAPKALTSMDVEYPVGAEGEATVELQLLVAADGSVQDVRVLQGELPFSTEAVSKAGTWRFEPAKRAGVPIAARIRVQVVFTPPVVEELPLEDEPTAEPAKQAAINQAEDAEEPVIDVVVAGERTVGVKKLGRAEVRQMPGAFGDPYRAIEALPGVTPIATGLPYFFIRGAPPGNVGYFFDETPVPLLYHVAAGPGVIHPAFIESVDLYSGAYPAKYGRFAGGIVAGEAAQPDYQFRGEASIRIVDAGAMLEIPFADGKGSAMLGGRYSYTGLVVSLLADDVTLGYWDYQGRIRYDLDNGDHLQLFGFGSYDFLRAANEEGVEQDLIDLTFHRLNATYGFELDAQSTLDLTLFGGYDLTGLGGDPDSAESEDLASLVNRSLGARAKYSHRFSPSLLLRAGADGMFSRASIDINTDQPDDDDDDERDFIPATPEAAAERAREQALPAPGFPNVVLDPLQFVNRESSEDTFNDRFFSRDDVVGGIWVEGVYNATKRITLTPGLRLDFYDTGGDVEIAVEPRIAARFDLTDKVSVTHDFGIAHQPPSFPIPIPGLSNGNASDGLQQAFQTSAGVEVELPAKFTASATLFQNVTLNSTDVFSLSRLEDSDPGANPFNDRTTAHTYGVELYLKRSLTEKLGGFIAYTWSRSTRSIPRVSGISSFDRTHVINAAAAYDLGRNWRLGVRTSIYSGVPAEVAYAGAAKNPFRGPWFYRFDWRLEKRWLLGDDGAWIAMVLEMLNTTLNKESLATSCYAYGCESNEIGPVAIPSIGVEASF